jgi:hypothetical protein
MYSRTIYDQTAAEKLLGRGDMLMQTSDMSSAKRIQGAFVSEQEVHNVADYLKGDGTVEYDESIVEKPSAGTMNMFGGSSDDQDPLFEESRQAIIQAGKASASFLQRRLKIGYARAARILDELEAAGIIGPGDGAKPREILTTEVEVGNSDMGMGQKFNVFGDSEEKVEENDSNEVEEENSSAHAQSEEETEEVVGEENNPDEEILEDGVESEEEIEEEKY